MAPSTKAAIRPCRPIRIVLGIAATGTLPWNAGGTWLDWASRLGELMP